MGLLRRLDGLDARARRRVSPRVALTAARAGFVASLIAVVMGAAQAVFGGSAMVRAIGISIAVLNAFGSVAWRRQLKAGRHPEPD